MFNSLTKEKSIIKTKVLTTLIAITAAIVLPQIFHALGLFLGLGSSLGTAFLPMHLAVLLAGLIAGSAAGLIAGIASPALSFAISGMPAAVMLPYMMIELACYGLVCGLLYKVKMPVILKLLSAQVAGRLLRAAAILIAIYGFNAQGVALVQTYNILLIGLPGIMLQWAVIPLVYYSIKGFKEIL